MRPCSRRHPRYRHPRRWHSGPDSFHSCTHHTHAPAARGARRSRKSHLRHGHQVGAEKLTIEDHRGQWALFRVEGSSGVIQNAAEARLISKLGLPRSWVQYGWHCLGHTISCHHRGESMESGGARGSGTRHSGARHRYERSDRTLLSYYRTGLLALLRTEQEGCERGSWHRYERSKKLLYSFYVHPCIVWKLVERVWQWFQSRHTSRHTSHKDGQWRCHTACGTWWGPDDASPWLPSGGSVHRDYNSAWAEDRPSTNKAKRLPKRERSFQEEPGLVRAREVTGRLWLAKSILCDLWRCQAWRLDDSTYTRMVCRLPRHSPNNPNSFTKLPKSTMTWCQNSSSVERKYLQKMSPTRRPPGALRVLGWGGARQQHANTRATREVIESNFG